MSRRFESRNIKAITLLNHLNLVENYAYFITWRRGRDVRIFLRQGRPVAEWPDAVSGRRCCTDTVVEWIFFNWKLIPCHLNELVPLAISRCAGCELFSCQAEDLTWFNCLIVKHLISVVLNCFSASLSSATSDRLLSSTELSGNRVRCWAHLLGGFAPGQVITSATGENYGNDAAILFGSVLVTLYDANCRALQLGAFSFFFKKKKLFDFSLEKASVVSVTRPNSAWRFLNTNLARANICLLISFSLNTI